MNSLHICTGACLWDKHLKNRHPPPKNFKMKNYTITCGGTQMCGLIVLPQVPLSSVPRDSLILGPWRQEERLHRCYRQTWLLKTPCPCRFLTAPPSQNAPHHCCSPPPCRQNPYLLCGKVSVTRLCSTKCVQNNTW